MPRWKTSPKWSRPLVGRSRHDRVFGQMRSLLVLVTCMLLVSTVGMSPLLTSADCAGTCPEEDGGGHCPPACVACACAGHTRADIPAALGFIAAFGPGRSAAFFEADPLLSAPHLADILHVPLTE